MWVYALGGGIDVLLEQIQNFFMDRIGLRLRTLNQEWNQIIECVDLANDIGELEPNILVMVV